MQLDLRVEQDLEVKSRNDGLRDDKEFESWFDGMQDDLEAATLEKYTYDTVWIILTAEHTAASCKQDYIHVIPFSHRHHHYCPR